MLKKYTSSISTDSWISPGTTVHACYFLPDAMSIESFQRLINSQGQFQKIIFAFKIFPYFCNTGKCIWFKVFYLSILKSGYSGS